jgi:cathepsin A (carboxypeptidase C)/serine carboxypeptidase-like clade 2
MHIAKNIFLAVATSAVFVTASDPNAVTNLPGLAPQSLCWKQYAGYLNATTNHQLYYWYHEAVEAPETKPWVLWLNGGPGCSSLGGMFTELGPFVLDNDQNITLNPFSFNKVANMLFIEQPAGVGFSYPNDAPRNDSIAAIDTDAALRSFLRLHPELKQRPFYVMGESYGGHYVPNTAKQIQETNSGLSADDRINLIGFAVGNGYTDWQLDFNANVENGRFHALTSQSKFEAAKQACDGDYARCFWPRKDKVCPDACNQAVNDAVEFAMDGSIDIYDIYEDVCLEPNTARLATQMTVLLDERNAQIRYLNEMKSSTSKGEREHRNLRAVISPVFPTCIDSMSVDYLNRKDVQAAMHVRQETIPNGKWSDCGNVKYDFNYESELPNYKQWVSEGDLDILIYNGDADFILSHMGNAAWINEGLNLTKETEWSKWYGSDGQVAGYFEKYTTAKKPMTFLTIKGAGHMVPRDRPQHALDFFTQFINGGNYTNVARQHKVQPLCDAVL